MIRIACGAGFSSDRLDPAVALVEHAALDVIVFECVGERTLAFGHRDRMRDPSKGYNALLERRLRAILPACVKNRTQIVTNMGVANPRAAAELAVRVARDMGLAGYKVACVEGDDVTSRIRPDTVLWEGGTVADIELDMVGANAYLGIDALLPALEARADLVICGRVADPSLFLAPLVHRLGWSKDDWHRLGAGTVVGHLLECGMQITGGYFADPGFKDVPRLAYCGFPYAEVETDGSATFTKLADAGGVVSPQTIKEQLLYEVHDPTTYITPDVIADFSAVQIAQTGPDRVRVSGASGRHKPESLKVTVGFDGGLLAEAGISYAGANAVARAELAREIVAERMRHVHGYRGPLRLDLIGRDSLHATAGVPPSDTRDLRLRGALRSVRPEEAEALLWEIESLLACGPAGGGGYRGSVTPSVVTCSAFIERSACVPSLTVLTA